MGRAIKDSFIEAGWDDPNAILAEMHEPEFKRFVEILRDDPKPDRGLRTLLARLEELGDYGFFDPGESQESLWETDQPIVIRLHTTQNDNLQKAFASLDSNSSRRWQRNAGSMGYRSCSLLRRQRTSICHSFRRSRTILCYD